MLTWAARMASSASASQDYEREDRRGREAERRDLRFVWGDAWRGCMSSELSQAIVLTSGGSKTSLFVLYIRRYNMIQEPTAPPARDELSRPRRRPQHLKFSHHTPGGLREVL